MNTLFADFVRNRSVTTGLALSVWLREQTLPLALSAEGIELRAEAIPDGVEIRLSCPAFLHHSNVFFYRLPRWDASGVAEFVAHARLPRVPVSGA